jgi:hypothetical protein
MIAPLSPRDTYSITLSRMSKAALVRLVHGQGNVVGAHPLETWNREELITEALRAQFGVQRRHAVTWTGHGSCSCGTEFDRYESVLNHVRKNGGRVTSVRRAS